MLVSELMRRAGVSRDTIRHYEQIGLLHERHFTKRPNGYRDYNETAVERIEFIKIGQMAGFPLRKIAKVADDWESKDLSFEEKKRILHEQLAEIDARIAELEALKEHVHYILEIEAAAVAAEAATYESVQS